MLWSLPMLFPRLQYPLHHPSDQQPVTNGDLSVCYYIDSLATIILTLFKEAPLYSRSTDKHVALPQITIASSFQIYLHSTRTCFRLRFHDLSTLLCWSLEQASPYARFYREFIAKVPIVININFLLTMSICCQENGYESLIKWSLKGKYFDLLSSPLN